MSLGIVKTVVRDCQKYCENCYKVSKLILGIVKIVIKYGQNYCGLSKYMVYRIVKVSFSNVKIVVRDWQNGL